MSTEMIFSAMRTAAIGILSTMLVACTTTKPGPGAHGSHKAVEPEINMVNYTQTECPQIWQINDEKEMQSGLYWQRAIDCAVRLSPAEARAEARRWPATHWYGALKQGVLLANGNVTPAERRQYLLRLDTFISDYPASIRPLIQLWRDNQVNLLQLSEERTRYHHLQQSSDAQLDALRQQQRAQTRELDLTRRKLETLTDIERQLSSRRSPDASDSGHGDNNAAPAEGNGNTPENATQDATQP
ncbi:two-component system QseEF-associated lipoprotein QseG [Erwinia oleae]|uniref:two-component system QseEF-associated lipoprotein QseG n=1 Tax=Erwinia oleae TaxID=796334 RepID=UPI001F366E51|nr:two-component system QseEF-associated lipoprotein QseG [Erwinia oleae]